MEVHKETVDQVVGSQEVVGVVEAGTTCLKSDSTELLTSWGGVEEA